MLPPFMIGLKIGNQQFTASLLSNESSKAFIQKLPLDLMMSELNANEKYADLKFTLPTNIEQVGKIQEGELMLYGTNILVVFYESFSTPYGYTRLGKISNVKGLKEALGKGNCRIHMEQIK